MKPTFLILMLFALTSNLWSGNSYYLQNGSEDEMKCTDCHSDIIQNKEVHLAAKEDCTTCHEPKGNSHPDDGLGMKLTAQVPDLCYMCHEGINSGSHIHSPVSNGECVKCHSPHSSEYKSLLIKEPKALCLSCHNKTYKSETGTTENIKRLIENSANIHGIIDLDGCLPCHKPHSSESSSLLKASYPDRPYTYGNKDDYSLCFDCHDSALLTDEQTKDATSFRNGEKNLHYIHLKSPKSRSCSNCHNIHASVNEHLIDSKTTFNKWDMPLNFTGSSSGGSCRTGCHGERSYTR